MQLLGSETTDISATVRKIYNMVDEVMCTEVKR